MEDQYRITPLALVREPRAVRPTVERPPHVERSKSTAVYTDGDELGSYTFLGKRTSRLPARKTPAQYARWLMANECVGALQPDRIT